VTKKSSERFRAGEDLHEPPGVLVSGPPGITPRTRRRQEELDRLIAEAGDGGPQPPGDGNIDHRNLQAAQEELLLAERMAAMREEPARDTSR
jgi:hypothetical protein